MAPTVLVACFGNVLRGDDGFGVEVARRLLEQQPPASVRVAEVGIGGIHIVQDLLDEVDILIAVDAVDLGRDPGAVVVIRPDVEDVRTWTLERRRDALADMHYSTPERVFLLARALDVLPADTFLVGGQVTDDGVLGEGLSPPLAAAVSVAAAEVRRVVRDAGVRWH